VTVETKKISELDSAGNIQEGDVLIGQRVSGTTVKITYDTSTLLSNTGGTGTGVYDFGGATTFEIPNSATPTLNANGQIAVDTTVTDFADGVLKYYGGAEMGVVAMPISEFSSPVDGKVIAYNGTTDKFTLTTVSASPGGSTTELQYNNAGAFAGISGATTNGTALTLVAPVLGTPASGTLTNCTGLPVAGGGTGVASNTAYAVLCGGTTSTGAIQSVASIGTSGQVLTSNGAGALPTFQPSNPTTESTFTPTIIGLTSAGAGTYSVQRGTYVRIGDVVWIEIYLTWSGHTGTGNMAVGGLPFQGRSGYTKQDINIVKAINYGGGAVHFHYITVTDSGTNATIFGQNGAGSETNVAIDGAAELAIKGVYFV